MRNKKTARFRQMEKQSLKSIQFNRRMLKEEVSASVMMDISERWICTAKQTTTTTTTTTTTDGTTLTTHFTNQQRKVHHFNVL